MDLKYFRIFIDICIRTVGTCRNGWIWSNVHGVSFVSK